MKILIVAIIAFFYSLGAFAQTQEHTRAGQKIIRDLCKSGLPVIHEVKTIRTDGNLVPHTSITSCVPKSGAMVIEFTCSFGMDLCFPQRKSQPAKDLEQALLSAPFEKLK